MPDARGAGPTWVGAAYAPYVPALLNRKPGLADYIELPFELIEHEPAVLEVEALAPVILHCASLNLAGFFPSPDWAWERVAQHMRDLHSPWLGEHLAFLYGEDGRSVGYTVAPALNGPTLIRVKENLDRARTALPAAIILENPPIYAAPAGSTMTVGQFFEELTAQSEVGILLDLTHHLITSRNCGLDPESALEAYPLERVVEIHLSGMTEQSGRAWDHHATRCPDAVWRLLDQALSRAQPRAITLEYNWSPLFPEEILGEDLVRAREAVDG
jgi:uncharacterized protein (UPF0276 family)